MVVGDLATAVDVVVLGAGPAGYVAAIRAAQLGKQVVVVDPNPPGGTCLREGCIPSKALLSATEEAARLPLLAEMGIETGPGRVDFARMQSWKDGIVRRLVGGVEKLLEGNGVTLVHGKGWFLAPSEVRVEGENGSLRYSFDQCIIAVGADPAPLPGLPFDGERVLTPGQLLQTAGLPASLAVVGSNYIAAELATIFARLGVRVRLLIPQGERLLGEFDALAGRLLTTSLKKLGIQIEANVADPAAAVQGAARVVVSMGVVPRTADLHLATVHLPAPAHGDGRTRGEAEPGALQVDGQMRTRNPAIYAIGDVTGGLPLATSAIKQGIVAAEALAGRRVEYAPQAVPRVAWTSPEVAAVGMTTAEAEAAGYRVTTGRFPFAASGRALTLGSSEGTALLVAEADSGVLLGATLVGPRASELIGELGLALEMGATLTDLAETLHPHPTLSEAAQEAAASALGAPVHILKPLSSPAPTH